MLNNDDIEILMDALDAWERAPGKDDILSGVFAAMLLGSQDDESKEKFKKRSRESGETAQLEVRTRKEQAIMLKAKLLMMRDASVVDEGARLLLGGE